MVLFFPPHSISGLVVGTLVSGKITTEKKVPLKHSNLGDFNAETVKYESRFKVSYEGMLNYPDFSNHRESSSFSLKR